jgi:hypothetical protein
VAAEGTCCTFEDSSILSVVDGVHVFCERGFDALLNTKKLEVS